MVEYVPEDYEVDVETEEDLVAPGDLPNFRLQQSSEFDDLDGEPIPESQPAYVVPEVIKSFVTHFHRHIRDRNVHEIHSFYENSFNKLSEKFFQETPWPPSDVIAPLVDNDQVFLMLYRELYYRHIYSMKNSQPSLEQRIGSWTNYTQLFDHLLAATGHLELELPNQWMWDMIDEFIYQFQAFCQYRSKLRGKEEHELGLLKSNPQVWSVYAVLNYLHQLVKKSTVVQVLEREKLSQDEQAAAAAAAAAKGFDFGSHTLYKMIGYFSLIGLLRIHCLLGDYHLALKTIDPIDLNKKGLFTKVTACHVTLYYYMGFAYLMMRRYNDTVRTFSTILLYISRTKQYHTRSYQYEQLIKKNEQMYSLLAMAVTLCPQRIDENVHNSLREKQGEKMVKLQRGDETVFDEMFAFACPKFVTPSPPNYNEENPMNYNQDALKHQKKLFLHEVRQQLLLPTIRSYLKLYTSIPISKLAKLPDDSLKNVLDENGFKQQLLCFKHKTRNPLWNGGSALNSKFGTSSDVDFYIDQDMVHIADTKVARKYGEYFMRHISKFEDIIHQLDQAKKTPAAVPAIKTQQK